MPDPTEPKEPEPTIYGVRLSEYGSRDLEAIVYHLDETQGRQAALAWRQGFYALIRGLAQNPRRFAVQQQESRKLGDEVRRELYQQTPGSAMVYAVFYFVQEAQDTSEDGPAVTIVHVRHASRRPMTRAEAKDIRAGQ